MSAFWCTLKVLDEINRMRAAIGNSQLVPESVEGGIYFVRIPDLPNPPVLEMDIENGKTSFLGVPIRGYNGE